MHIGAILRDSLQQVVIFHPRQIYTSESSLKPKTGQNTNFNRLVARLLCQQ